jgi:hypothetical protein
MYGIMYGEAWDKAVSSTTKTPKTVDPSVDWVAAQPVGQRNSDLPGNKTTAKTRSTKVFRYPDTTRGKDQVDTWILGLGADGAKI